MIVIVLAYLSPQSLYSHVSWLKGRKDVKFRSPKSLYTVSITCFILGKIGIEVLRGSPGLVGIQTSTLSDPLGWGTLPTVANWWIKLNSLHPTFVWTVGPWMNYWVWIFCVLQHWKLSLMLAQPNIWRRENSQVPTLPL